MTTDTDGVGNVYSSGGTASTFNIATSGAHKTTQAGSYDGMIVKFNNSGSRQWARYYGGSGVDEVYGSVTDGTSLYVVGSTSNIATFGAHQTSFGGAGSVYGHGFIAMFNASNGTMGWGSYYGGTSGERTVGVTLYASGNLYVAGYIQSSNGISTSGAFQPNFGGSFDGFLVKFNNSGVRQ